MCKGNRKTVAFIWGRKTEELKKPNRSMPGHACL